MSHSHTSENQISSLSSMGTFCEHPPGLDIKILSSSREIL